MGAAERKRLARQPKEEQSTLQAAQDTTIEMTDVELGRMVIENAQQNGGNVDIVKQLTDLSEKVTEELNAAHYTYSQSEKKTSFAQRLNQSEMGSNSIIDYPDRINNKDGSTSDYKDAVAANRLANQALARITNVEKAEKKSKVGATFQGIKDAAMDPEIWMMGLTDLVDIQRLYKVAQKYENGIELSQSEEDLLEAAALNMTAEMDYSNRAYNLGVGVGESLAYMAEFSINQMATAGPAIAKGMGKTILKTITKKALSQISRKSIKIGCRAIGDVVAASAMSTMPTQIARVASDAYQRKMGEIKIDVDDDGLIRYKGVEGGENTWWGAAVKAYGANTIENWSEMFGNYLSFGKLGKGVKPADLKGVKRFLYNLDTGYWSRAMKQYLDRANWHGTAGEFVEEIVNNLANSAIIGDMSWNPNSENYIWNKDTLVDTFLAVAIFGGFASTFQTGLYIGGRAKLNSDHKKRYADGLLQFADNWEDMSAGIDNVVDEAIATDDVSPLRDMLKNVAADPDMSAREKTVYARYVTNALQRKGNEEMLVKAMEESAFMKNIHEAHKQNISRLQKMDQKDLDMEMRNAFLQYHGTAAQMDEGELDMTVQEIEDYIAEHPEREDIINEYIAARNTMDAYRELAEAGYHAERVRYNEEIENQTNSDGNVYYAQDLQGNNIVIVDGTLILHDDGTIDIEQSKNIVAVGEDGQRRMIAISDIRDDTPIITSDPEELKANKRREIKEAIDNMAYAAMMTRTDEEILSDASEQFGQKVMMNIGGEVVEAEPIQITPEGEVVVQFNRPGGKTISAMSAEMWDASVIKSVKKQPAATEAETEAQEAAQPSQGTQAEAKQALPLDKNGNADYDALLDMDADRYAAELESKMGAEKTLKFIGGKLKRLDEEIAKLEKKHGNETNENKYIQQEEQLDALNRKKHALSSLIARAANAASEVQEVQEQAEIAQGKSVQGSNITNKYADAKKTYGNKETRTLADGTTLTGRWVVAEADAVTPSHDPFTQQPTDGYPTTADGNNINDNDYRGKGALVSQMANGYDARAIDNPVFTKDGVVVSGNNRTMSSIVAAKQGTDVKYREALAAKVQSFGISPESLNEFEHPRVFFEIEDDVPMTTEFMAKFNQRESKSKTPTERAIVASKRNNATLLAKLGVILDRFDSLAELYSNEAACTQVIFALQEAGIINQNEVPELMDAGSLTAAGKDFVEVFLLGASFSEKVIGILSKDGMKSYRAKIVKAILPIIENKQLNERSILSDITAAVIYIYQAKSVNLPLLDYITTGNMFEQIKWRVPALINAIKLLESEKSFREFVVLCNSILGEETPDMFTNEVITTDAFYSEYEKQLNDEQKKILHYARQVNGTTEAEATSGKQGDNVQSNHGNNDTAAEVSPAGSEREEREERQPRGEQQQSGVAEEAKLIAEERAADAAKPIQGTSLTRREVEDDVISQIDERLLDVDVEIEDMLVVGSRTRNEAREDSDLDVVVEYSGNISEHDLFNILNDESNPIVVDGLRVDINPITAAKSGTLSEWLARRKKYDQEKAATEAAEKYQSDKKAKENTDKKSEDSSDKRKNARPTDKQEAAKKIKTQEEPTLGGLFGGLEAQTSENKENSSDIKEKDVSLSSPKNKIESNDNGRKTEVSAGVREESEGVGGDVQRETNGTVDKRGVDRSDAEHTVHNEAGGGRVSGTSNSAAKLKLNLNNFSVAAETKRNSPSSPQARYKANVAAITLMRKLVEEGVTNPTEEQKKILSQFSGWGGLGTYFTYENREELLKIMSESEYKSALESTKDAFYTPNSIINVLWKVAEKLEFKGGPILEGSAGIGNILSLMPQAIKDSSAIQAIENDEISGNILKLLYPDANVSIQGFEDTAIENGSVALAITNVPFVTGLRVHDAIDHDLSKRFSNIHDFCIAKNIRKLAPGGIGTFITTSGSLDKSTSLRSWVTNEGRSDVVGAFRLNNKTFEGTQVTSDIIIVRKRVGGIKSPNAIDVSSVATARVVTYESPYEEWDNRKREYTHPERSVAVEYNLHFINHPEDMGGEMFSGAEKNDTYRPDSIGLYPTADIDQEERLKLMSEEMLEQEHV